MPDSALMERLHLGANELTGWRRSIYTVIFESDTPADKAFDVGLIVLIVASVFVVMMESVASFRTQYGPWLFAAEWVFTILFTFEYLFRLVAVRHQMRYAKSFFGVVDLLAVIPTYVSVLLPGAQFFLAIRLLRILRVFRVLKLAHYVSEADVLLAALRASRRKILIFVFFVMTLVVVLGSLMYLVEGAGNGFTSIPRSVYWAIVTLTTVGYGDISPRTGLGQALASVVMITGFAIIAVPTGIVTSELNRLSRSEESVGRTCSRCDGKGHQRDAAYCRLCGESMEVSGHR